MQDGLQEVKEPTVYEVSSLRGEIEAAKTNLEAKINSVKSELKADIGAAKLEPREEGGKTHKRLGKMDEQFEDADEQLEAPTTSVNMM